MEIFDFAMKMELQGKAVYENLSASAKLPGISTIYASLAADEQKHYEVFRDLKAGKQWVMTDSPALDQARTVFAQLLSEKDRALDLHEDLDAFRVGLQMELDSIKLYEGMAKKEDDPEKSQLYLRLANEEKKHYNIIDNICDFLTRPKYYLAWREFSNLDEL
jgi:rubrerythrin